MFFIKELDPEYLWAFSIPLLKWDVIHPETRSRMFMNHYITGHLNIQIVNDFETIESRMQMND